MFQRVPKMLDGCYTAKSAYNMLQAGSAPFQGHKLIWKTWAPLRIKIFLWLAFRRRHWTADQRQRHGLEARDLCYLCDHTQETIDHIVAACFTKELWYYILQALGKQLPPAAISIRIWWHLAFALGRRSTCRFRLLVRTRFLANMEGAEHALLPSDTIHDRRPSAADQGRRRSVDRRWRPGFGSASHELVSS